MWTFTDVLDTSPNTLVSGLPASATVDWVLTETPDIIESKATHMASTACLDTWVKHGTVASAVGTCANPETLLEAFRRFGHGEQIRTAILTNPATPRTPEIVAATARRAESNLDSLLDGFARHYVQPRRAQYRKDVHADLRDALLTVGKNELGKAVAEHLHPALYLVDPRIPYDTFFPSEVGAHIDAAVTRELCEHHQFIEGRAEDGTLKISHVETLPEGLVELLARRPETLSTQEQGHLRELILWLPEDDWVNLRDHRQLITRLGNHALRLEDLDSLRWLLELDLAYVIGEVQPGVRPRWTEDWVAGGETKSFGFETPWPLAPAIGQAAWAQLGDDPSAWALFLSLAKDGWEGTFPELLTAVKATA